ncbi:MAG: hypothetical protein RLZZ227_2106 [Pseudomonadota bacterium]|jgi:uncharacterized RDD family membrane protein YckC
MTSTPVSDAAPVVIAPLWRRIAAILYDSFLVFAIWIVVGFFVLWAFGIEEARTIEGEAIELDPLYQYTLLTAMFLSAYLFFGFFWTHSGQTLGMQAWRIKVRNADGSAISWRQALLRICSAPFALLVFGLGYLCMLIDPRQRTLPDIVSGSQVVREFVIK